MRGVISVSAKIVRSAALPVRSGRPGNRTFAASSKVIFFSDAWEEKFILFLSRLTARL